MKWLGLLSVILCWAGIGYIIKRWHNPDLRTISKHAAQDKHNLIVFASLLIGLGLLFYGWVMLWLVPTEQPSQKFVILISLTMVFQILTSLLPDTTKRLSLLHRIAAYSMAFLYLPTSLSLAVSVHMTSAGVNVMWLIILMMSSIGSLFLVGIAVGGRLWASLRPNYLYFQATYILLFQCTFLVAAYL